MASKKSATKVQRVAPLTSWDKRLHIPLPLILVFISFSGLFWGFPHGWYPLCVIVTVDVYLVVMLMLAAWKIATPIPLRRVALALFPLLFLALVMSFAQLYRQNGHIQGTSKEAQDAALTKPSDFAYFSLVTITTLGYGDYIPTDTTSRWLVMAELLSGALLLLGAIPVLASRLALFDEAPGSRVVIGIRRLEDGQWEVQENAAFVTKHPAGERLTIEAVVGGKIENISSQ
jgi:Ion channel